MAKCIEHLENLYKGINTGRADPNLLAVVRVILDGTSYRLDQLSVLSRCGPQLLKVEPFDTAWLKRIEAAINAANLGVTTDRAPHAILVKIPQLDGSRRQELLEVAKGLAEEQRIAIRHLRREARKALPKEHQSIETMTKEYITAIDELLDGKREILCPPNLRFN